jgi:hypothetical protein
MIVYNLLGKEVTTLINEEKAAGNYSLEFNAYGLPSGIYTCRMETVTFSEVKKLMLLKLRHLSPIEGS